MSKRILGDINGDGKIDSADLILLRADIDTRRQGGNSILTDEQKWAASVYNRWKDTITEADYMHLQAHIIGAQMINEIIEV